MVNRFMIVVLSTFALAACHAFAPRPGVQQAAATPASSNAWDGVYDNHAQVWTAHEAGQALAPPHLVVVIQPLREAGWSLWQLRLDVVPPVQATWAMQRTGSGQDVVLLPHRALQVAATDGAFDPAQWAPLQACALHAAGGTPAQLVGDAAACATIAPELGAQAALLPLAVEQAGDRLRLRLYADQARGPDAHEDARRVEPFHGWAAINGAGPAALANSADWHMDRALELGSEGGTRALHWRDGKPSGWSLLLERLTYRDGNVPVLKLSVVEDASGRTLAYAWANDEATRIGINLGWLQVGLERGPPAVSAEARARH